MNSKRKQTFHNAYRKLILFFRAAIIIVVIVSPIYFIVNWIFIGYALKNESKVIKGVIIDKESYVGHSPVKHSFYYMYEFKVNGKIYFGDSRNSKYSPGDSVEIEYLESNPSNSQIKYRQ